MNIDIDFLINAAVPALTGVVSFFVGHRKAVSDAKNSELNNTEHAIKIWRETAENLENRIAKMSVRMGELEEKLDIALKENRHLMKALSHYQNQQTDKI